MVTIYYSYDLCRMMSPAGEMDEPMIVDTPGGRFRVHYDEELPASPLGPLVFFAQFFLASGRFDALCRESPLDYRSPNAPDKRAVWATWVLGILAGYRRYAHLNALRFDRLAAGLMGVEALVSEDSVRHALYRLDPLAAERWLRAQFDAVVENLLEQPWVLDTDVTVKPLYGRQEEAELGYNPKKPGRPSHAYHTYWMARLRLCIDVEVRPGKEHGVNYGLDGLFAWIDSRPRCQWPHLVRGDCAYGQEAVMVRCETRGPGYLFKLRRTKNACRLLAHLEATAESAWQPIGQKWEAAEGELALQGWSRRRRVVALRRRLADAPGPRAEHRSQKRQALPLWELSGVTAEVEVLDYEYQLLVTNLPYEALTLATLYRERGDAENPFDELKNQWGWSGFTSRKLRVSQISARLNALVYNWWSLYARLIEPEQHHEAIRSRPRLLGGVACAKSHAGQNHLAVRLLHSEAPLLRPLIEQAARFLQILLTTSEQLKPNERWRLILQHIFGRLMPNHGPSPPALPSPAPS